MSSSSLASIGLILATLSVTKVKAHNVTVNVVWTYIIVALPAL